MSFLGKGGGGGSVWRQINAWRRGQTVGWETNRARAVFRRRCHAPMATLECFGSFRLIVSHKLSSAVFKQDGQDRGFHWRGYTWAQQRTCLIYLREAALKFRLGEKKKFGGIVRDENELLCRIRWLTPDAKEQLNAWHPLRSAGIAGFQREASTLSYKRIRLINQRLVIFSLIISLINTYPPIRRWCWRCDD